MELLDQIIRNSQTGYGPCEGCPAQETLQGRYVNPGHENADGELMFVTDEPTHTTDWDKYDSWREYNEEWFARFKRFRGGRFIFSLLDPTDLTLDDVWVGDSVRCPTQRDADKEIPEAETGEAAKQCRPYLRDEIEMVDPEGIITLGRGASIRTSQALGVPYDEAKRVRVTEEYDWSEFATAYPTVISLHWAQRSVKKSEWVPPVKTAIQELVDTELPIS